MDKTPLTYRQRRFVKAVFEGRSYAAAAREAGYAESVAHCAGQKLLRKPAVQAKLNALVERRGLGDRTLAHSAARERLLADYERLNPDNRQLHRSTHSRGD